MMIKKARLKNSLLIIGVCIGSMSLFLLIPSCQKSVLQNPSTYIRGRVSVMDQSDKEIPSIDKTKIELKLTTDSSNINDFMYSTFADKDGYFIFQLPCNDLQDIYFVFCEYRNRDSIIYYGMKPFTKSGNDGFAQQLFELKPNYKKQNYYSITIKDNFNQNVGNCNLYFFTNEQLAANAYDQNSSFSLVSGIDGRAGKYNFTSGTYYVNAYKDYGGGLILKRKLRKIIVRPNTLQINDTITVFK